MAKKVILAFLILSTTFSVGHALPNSQVALFDYSVHELTLEQLKNEWKKYENQRVRLTCRYDKIFSISKYQDVSLTRVQNKVIFSVWDPKTCLFEDKQLPSSLPLCYVIQGGKAQYQLAQLSPFDMVSLKGRIVPQDQNHFLIKVNGIEKRFPEIAVNENLLKRSHLAYQLLTDGHHRAAIGEWQSVLESLEDPFLRAQILKYLGRAFFLESQFSQAAENLDQSLEVFLEPQTATWLGETLIASREFSEAAQVMEEMVENFPTDVSCRMIYAQALKQKGDLEGCFNQAQAVLALSPGHPQAYLLVGKALKRTGNGDQIISFYREAIDQSSGDVGFFHLELARLYSRRKQYDYAANEYELAKRSYPKRADIYLEAARALRERGSRYHRQAALNFDRSLALQPNQKPVYLELAQMHFQDGEFSEVIKTLKPYFAMYSEDLQAHVMIGLAHERLGHFQKAAEHFVRAESLDSLGFHSHHLGFNLEALKRYREAAQAYERALDRGLKRDFQFDTAYRAGAIWLSLDAFEKALPLAGLAHKLKENHLGAAINMGLAQEGLGDHQEALKTFALAFGLKSQNPTQKAIVSHHWVWNSLILGQKNGQQVKYSQEAWENRGDLPSVRLTYGWALARHGESEAQALLEPLVIKYPEARLGLLELFLAQKDFAKANEILKEPLDFKKSKLLKKQYQKLLKKIKKSS